MQDVGFVKGAAVELFGVTPVITRTTLVFRCVANACRSFEAKLLLIILLVRTSQLHSAEGLSNVKPARIK